jgi:hypothetical protein
LIHFSTKKIFDALVASARGGQAVDNLYVLIVQRIERELAELKIQVRFLVRTQIHNLVAPVRLWRSPAGSQVPCLPTGRDSCQAHFLIALVVQRIEREFPELKIEVRLLMRAQDL